MCALLRHLKWRYTIYYKENVSTKILKEYAFTLPLRPEVNSEVHINVSAIWEIKQNGCHF